MQALFRLFWDIALWRSGPRDVPASGGLLAFVSLVYVGVSALQSTIVHGPALALMRGLVDLGVTLFAFLVPLAVTRRAHRWLQTVTAVLGTGVLLALPMVAISLVATYQPIAPLRFLLVLGSLVLLIWYLFVLGNIAREALDAPLFTGMAIAMSYFIFAFVVLTGLLPAGG